MKLIMKLGILLAMMLSTLLGNAQSKSDKIYDTFSGKDGVTTLSFSKSAIKPFEMFIDDDTKKVIYKMQKVRFMFYNEEKGELSTTNVYDRITKELNGAGYFEIDPDEINCDNCDISVDNHDKVKLIGHGKRNNMDEFHIVIADDDSDIMFSFYGDITVDDLKECGKFSHSTKHIITQ